MTARYPRHRQLRRAVPLLLLALTDVVRAGAIAQHVEIAIPAGRAVDSVRALARQTNLNILLSGQLADDVMTNALHGSFTPADAVTKIIAGTSLTFAMADEHTVTIWSCAEFRCAASDLIGSDTQKGRGRPADNGNRATGVNIRGLGPAATLILLNGHRIAKRGTDALYTESDMFPIEGLQSVARLGHMQGWKWNDTHFEFAMELRQQNAPSANERSQYTNDLTRFGGSDFRTPYSQPGTILAGSQTYKIPANQDGTNLTSSSFSRNTENLTHQLQGKWFPYRSHHCPLVQIVVRVLDQD